ncbi:alpha-amylase domain-containing protein [uncultured Capnocytophaga sp.]|nr:alpha-amylase domain-containing protein [uncultured Capnocytophaga sp.]
MDYTGNSTQRFANNSEGRVTIKVPANSYTIWSVEQ